MTAAVECLESFERLEQDRVEKDVQIRQDAERDLNQAQTDLAAQMESLQAAANQRQQQIRTSRDERLKEVEADMAQRRREIRARIDSIVFSQASNPSTTANVTSAMDHEVVASNDTDRIARTEAKRPPPTVADSVPNITIGQLPISGNQFLAAGEPRLTTIARAPMLHDNFWLDANPQVDSVGVGLWKTDQKQTQPTPNSYHLADEEGLPPSEHICCGCCGQDDAAFCFACLGDHC